MNKKCSYSHFGTLGTLLLIVFIDSFGYFLVIPVLLHLIVHDSAYLFKHVSIADRDFLNTFALMLAPLALLISAPFIGKLSDQYGRRHIMLVCLFASLLGFILPMMGIFYHRAYLLLLGRFIVGLGSGSQPIAQASVTDMAQGKSKAYYLSLVAFVMTLALVLGPLAGWLLSDSDLFRDFNDMTPYGAGAILSLLNILLLWFFFQETGHPTSLRKVTLAHRLKTLATIITRPRVGALLLIFFVLEFSWSGYYQTIFIYLARYAHYSSDQTWGFTTYIGLWMGLGLTLIYPLILRYFKLSHGLRFSLILATLGLLGSTLWVGLFYQWLSVIFLAVFVGCAYSSLLAIISDHIDSEHQGAIMGAASTLLGIAWMITPLCSTYLMHIHSTLPLWCFSLVLVVGTLYLLALHPANRG